MTASDSKQFGPVAMKHDKIRHDAWSVFAMLLALVSLLPDGVLHRTPEWQRAPLRRRKALLKCAERKYMRVTLVSVAWVILIFACNLLVLTLLLKLIAPAASPGSLAAVILVGQVVCRPRSIAYIYCLRKSRALDSAWTRDGPTVLPPSSVADLGPLVMRFDVIPRRPLPWGVAGLVAKWALLCAAFFAGVLVFGWSTLVSTGVFILFIAALVMLGFTTVSIIRGWRRQPGYYALHEYGFAFGAEGMPAESVPFNAVRSMKYFLGAERLLVQLKDFERLELDLSSNRDLEDAGHEIWLRYKQWKRGGISAGESAG